MRLLFLGDIVGRAGRKAVIGNLPRLRSQLKLDFVVANGENAAHGFGITPGICQSLFDAGVDCITGGNHSWDQSDILAFADQEPRLLRPVNFAPGTPGRGCGLYEVGAGLRVLVVNIMGRLFMEPVDDPFRALDQHLPTGTPGEAGFDCVIVDFHGEATSEKTAAGHFCDGRASFVVGTHTHVPTADARILPGGSAYMSDAGMCGDYNSVIGMKTDDSLARFLGRLPRPRLAPAEGEGSLCGALLETAPETGLAQRISAFRLGGALETRWPD